MLGDSLHRCVFSIIMTMAQTSSLPAHTLLPRSIFSPKLRNLSPSASVIEHKIATYLLCDYNQNWSKQVLQPVDAELDDGLNTFPHLQYLTDKQLAVQRHQGFGFVISQNPFLRGICLGGSLVSCFTQTNVTYMHLLIDFSNCFQVEAGIFATWCRWFMPPAASSKTGEHFRSWMWPLTDWLLIVKMSIWDESVEVWPSLFLLEISDFVIFSNCAVITVCSVSNSQESWK